MSEKPIPAATAEDPPISDIIDFAFAFSRDRGVERGNCRTASSTGFPQSAGPDQRQTSSYHYGHSCGCPSYFLLKRQHYFSVYVYTMSYPSSYDNAGTGAGPRQAPSPNQGMNQTNGVNGAAVSLPGMMGGLPTPAGTQSDLNYIMEMVEQLGKVLEENRLASSRIIEASGRVRAMACERNMTNEEVVEAISNDMNESTRNLEVEVSAMSAQLEKAKSEARENLDIAYAYAKTVGGMLEQAHAFKAKTVADMSSWHASYRKQLEEERAENLRLRALIGEMQASAARGTAALRKFRAEWDGSDRSFYWQAEATKYKQLARSYKRMAFPEVAPDDAEFFSDDDDLLDPEEKKRLARDDMARLTKKKEDRMAMEGAGPMPNNVSH